MVLLNLKIEQQQLGPYLVNLTMTIIIIQRQTINPRLFVQIHQHSLFQFVFAVVDGNRVVVSVEAMNES